ncbi:PEP-CTERM sorting domain-containing protein [Aliiglaciecola sp. SL4]|uniref:PEP-CTERM sorting domain-containing protein n=1 Tax=Aliiglaciecola sp. SL4 TaxID=3239806 RepID=UPI00355B79EB
MKLKKILLGAVLVLASSISNAGLITASDVTASSTFFSYNVDNLINGSGLSGAEHSGNFVNKWMTDGTVTGVLTFDLGAIFDISSSSIWNYGGGCCGTGRSVKDLGIEGSLDGVTYFTIGDFVLNESAGTPIFSETIALNTTAQYLKFNLNSNYGDTFTGLSEVQFDGVISSVPEPTSIALFSLCLALIGFSRKK